MSIRGFLRGRGELKQVIVVRNDLKMSKGKTAAQVAHASLSAAEKSSWKKKWLSQGQKKSVLGCKDLDELRVIHQDARESNLPVALITDQGRTELAQGTTTCLGIGPAPEKNIDGITGELKLF